MAYRSSTVQVEHDDVVRASAKTYGKLEQEGHKVDINPDGEKNRSVGPESNPRYPDVIVWVPKSLGSTSGTAKIIEEIETVDSVTETESAQWKDYGGLGIKFLLVVPKGYGSEATRLVSKNGANVSELWQYHKVNGQIQFEKYN